MGAQVLIPTALRPYAESHSSLEVEGATVGEVLANLAARYGELRRHLFDDAGKLRGFVNVYLNDTDFRSLAREATPVGATDVVRIVPAIAGGCEARAARASEARR